METAFATLGLSVATFVLSVAGLFPVARLFTLRKGRLRLIHLLSLQVVAAVVYAYVTSFLPERARGGELPLLIAFILVATFWWQFLARWTVEIRDSISVLFYLSSTVLFAFLSPIMIALNGRSLFERVHPTMSPAPILFVVLIHAGLYFSAYWATGWFISLPNATSDG